MRIILAAENLVISCAIENNPELYLGTLQAGVGQGHSQDFSKGGSHCVKQYCHGIFTTEYCRLFICLKKDLQRGEGHGHPRSP